MKNSFYNYGVVFLAVLFVASCGSSPETPEHTATVLPPSPTQPPPTITPTNTKTPRPTWTPPPMGTFFGCTYFEGELVAGDIVFHPVQDEETTIEVTGNSSGCVTKNLRTGSYWIYALYWKGDCATAAGCRSVEEGVQVEIKTDETTEMNFEIQAIN